MITNKIEQLLIFLKEDPADVFTIYALALEHIKIHEPEKAIAYLEKVLSINPDYVAAYYQLAMLKEKISREEANAVYLKGIAVAAKVKNLHAKAELTMAYNSFNGLEE